MSTQTGFALRGRNPDVLTCIANLSNDEVFTPPEFANRMLDTLSDAWTDAHDGADIWSDPTVRFLDPVTKSGVFLREITSRLTKGLEAPNSLEGTCSLTSSWVIRRINCSPTAGRATSRSIRSSLSKQRRLSLGSSLWSFRPVGWRRVLG